mgnify:FL=1
MDKKLSVGALVVALVALGVAYFAPTTVIQPTKEALKEVVKEVVRGLGSMPGNEVSGPDFKVNGLREVSVRTELQQGTSTICAIPSPVGSSTPIYFGVQLDSTYGTTAQGAVVDLFVSSEDRATTTTYATSSTNLIGSPFWTNLARGATIFVTNGATTTGTAPDSGSGTGKLATTTAVATSFGPQDLNGGSRFDFLAAKISNSASGDYREYAPVGACYAKFLVHDSQ